MRSSLHLTAVLICAALGTSGIFLFPESVGAARQRAAAASRYAADELLIQFDGSATDSDRAAVRSRLKATRKRRIRADRRGELEVAALPGGTTVAAAIQLAEQDPKVRFAEPNWIYSIDATSNDPSFLNGSLWGMLSETTSPANTYGSQAAELWQQDIIGSDTVYVGVLDTGTDVSHPDLAANVWRNSFDPVDGVDNDGNGYVDDVNGWDFMNQDNSVSDDNAHGTHVAGTIGAVGGNGIGVAGMNWRVRIITAKFLDAGGSGSTSNAVRALDYLTDLKTRHNLNIVATNNSWGGGGVSQALHSAILRAAKAGILFMAAAGNGNLSGVGQNNDSLPFYPANYDTTVGTVTETAATYDAVLSVAAINSTGARASFSNYGTGTVDLGAPGVGIRSTTPNGTYSSYNGTSMATPHVVGAAALYASLHDGTSAASIRNAILAAAAATTTPSMAGITVTGGRLNVGEFLTGSPPPPPPPPPPPQDTPPAAPSALAGTAPANPYIDLRWVDNATNEAGYRVQRCKGSTCAAFVTIAELGPGVQTYRDTAPKRRTYFRYRVQAFNSAGASAYSNVVKVKSR